MYLKALEIQGFKSFPDKLRLSFEGRVCAIVGPNGSGKSNISDAICWVLGEQRSKALRGSRMEDILFGGTAERSEAGFAQVSLILGNEDRRLDCDADEVTVTRRYYRSGESEYYINRSMVRLKDLQRLIMDTGLGRDGYSLVGQGRVDDILSAKSTERREVFEEAAGISKYRSQKEEAEGRLSRASDSLLRVGDKIEELEREREPLKKQAEEARRYLLLRDELRGLEVSLWMDELDRLSSENRALTDDCEAAGKRLEEAKNELETLYTASESISREIYDAAEAAERLRESIGKDEAEAARLARERAIAEADIRSNEAAILRLEGENRHQVEREAELQARLADRREMLEKLSAAAEALEQARGELTEKRRLAEAESAEAEENARRIASEAAEAERDLAAAEARSEAVRDNAAAQQSRSREADEERNRLKERFQEELRLFGELERGTEERRRETEQAEENERQLRQTLAESTERLETLTETVRQLRSREASMLSRLHLLKEMEQEYEGFSKAVRAVMREHESGRLGGLHGTVAELIRTDDRYTAAVETALGSSLQSIVVSREEDGRDAIRFLKRHDAGRATFLPLSAIRGGVLRERGLENEKGVEGIASALVSFQEDYRSIVENLLGRTVIVDTLDSAIAISRRYGGRFRIVTLDGQLINAGGSMTGGSAARNVGILSRSNEAKRLALQHEELTAEIAGKEKRLELLAAEKIQAERQADGASRRLRELQDGLLKKETELKQRRMLTEAVEAALKTAEEALNRSEQDEQRLARSAEEAGRETAGLRERIDRLRNDLREAEKRRSACAERLKTLSGEESELNAREAALETEKRSHESGMREWEELLSGYGEDKTDRERLKQAHAEKNAELHAALSRLGAEEETVREKLERERPLLQAASERRKSFEEQRTENERKTQTMNRETGELERQYSELEKRKLAVDLEEKQILDRLWNSYELSRTAAQQQRLKLESTPKAVKRSAQLRKMLSAMGSPNIGAIAEFDRIDERYDYLTGQRRDILKAKKELEQVIAALTEEMENIFAREFNAVAESFRKTFEELFGGGRGEIRLEDPEHILESGIEIRVQPPGKSLRMLSLLSGGERAFVAIALYFSMLKVRPAPFCVLDEIESALDESNVIRFARYLRTMTEQTQFLCVTHRRGSMEEADMLYGVTMQKGVSKVLRLELSEAIRHSED